jgi:putative addiction module component (TIGR02574 family)
MASRTIDLDQLTAEERLALIGELWDSLDPTVAAPITPALAEELDRREAEADSDPAGGDTWVDIKADLRRRLR